MVINHIIHCSLSNLNGQILHTIMVINISVHSPWPMAWAHGRFPVRIFAEINPEDWTTEHEKRIEKFLASGMSLGVGLGYPTTSCEWSRMSKNWHQSILFFWAEHGLAKPRIKLAKWVILGQKPTTDKYFMIPYILITIILVAFWAPQFFDQPTLLPTWLQTIDRPVFQTAYCTGDLCCSIAVLPSKNYPKVSNSYYRVNPSHIWLWINTY